MMHIFTFLAQIYAYSATFCAYAALQRILFQPFSLSFHAVRATSAPYPFIAFTPSVLRLLVNTKRQNVNNPHDFKTNMPLIS